MLIERVITEEIFIKEIQRSNIKNPFFPILITNARKNYFIEKIDPNIANLTPGILTQWFNNKTNLLSLRNHAIIGVELDITKEIAKCYARLLSRPFIILNQQFNINNDNDENILSHSQSFTVIVPININNPYHLIDRIQKFSFQNKIKKPIAFLVAEDLEILTWLILKQIIRLTSQNSRNPPIVINQLKLPVNINFADQVYAQDVTSSNLYTSFNKFHNTLLLGSHSRPHCGYLNTTNSIVGICGSPSKGTNGKCFREKSCIFDLYPKICMEDLETDYLFYNGCSTIKFSDAPIGIPRSSNLSLAAIRGKVSQIIGNYSMGYFSEWDLIWFIALSSLKYSPAAAIDLIHKFRKLQNQEITNSLILIGDAASSPWPFNLSIADVKIQNNEVLISWYAHTTILVASINGFKWMNLVKKGLFVVLSNSSRIWTQCHAGIIGDESNNVTIICMTIPKELADGRLIQISIKKRKNKSKKILGKTLYSAIKQIKFLCRCKSFKNEINNFSEEMTNRLIELKRFKSSKINILNKDDKKEALYIIEQKVASSADKKLLEIASNKSAFAKWYWEEEYINYVQIKCLDDTQTCLLCGQLAYKFNIVDIIDKSIIRTQIICVECGLVSDLPVWSLDIKLINKPSFNGQFFSDILQIKNTGKEDRPILTRMTINGFSRIQYINKKSDQIILKDNEQININLQVKLLNSISGYYWIRIYIASLGGFGFVARPFIF